MKNLPTGGTKSKEFTHFVKLAKNLMAVPKQEIEHQKDKNGKDKKASRK